MVEETNRYAAQTLSADTANQPSDWTLTNVPEMMAFVALLVCMGINQQKTSIQHALAHVRSPAKSPAFVDHGSQYIHSNPSIFAPRQQPS